MGGGGGSKSSSDSIGESIARQVLYQPTAESIQRSMDQLRGYTDLSNAKLQPYTQTAKDAMNDMRFWQGMAAVDPMGEYSETLRGLTTALRAPAAALVDPATGRFMANKDQYVDASTPYYATKQDYLNANPYSVGNPSNQYIVNPMTGQKMQIQGPLQFGQSAYANLANEPETWDPNDGVGAPGYNPAGITGGDLSRYVFDSQYNTDAVTIPLTSSVNALARLALETDPDKRQALYDEAMAGFDKYNTTTEQILSGAFGQQESAGFRQQWEYINKLKGEVQSSFKREAPKAPTGEEVYKRLSETPGYQSRLNQGLNNIQNTQVAKGLFGSGRAGMELTRYGQEYASRELEAQFQRSGQLAGLTMPAVQQSSQSTQQLGVPMAQATQDMGRVWMASPWTSKQYQMSRSESETKEGMGGLGQIAGTLLGGLFG